MPQPILRHIARRAMQAAILAAGILAVLLGFSRHAHAASLAPPAAASGAAPVTSATGPASAAAATGTGTITSAPTTVLQTAMGAGRRAATSIHEYLQKQAARTRRQSALAGSGAGAEKILDGCDGAAGGWFT